MQILWSCRQCCVNIPIGNNMFHFLHETFASTSASCVNGALRVPQNFPAAILTCIRGQGKWHVIALCRERGVTYSKLSLRLNHCLLQLHSRHFYILQMTANEISRKIALSQSTFFISNMCWVKASFCSTICTSIDVRVGPPGVRRLPRNWRTSVDLGNPVQCSVWWVHPWANKSDERKLKVHFMVPFSWFALGLFKSNNL